MEPSPSEKGVPGKPGAGVKRPAAALLPAFEPLSSSPSLPRPPKRSRESLEDSKEYPTPVPTSSTVVPSSSPPRSSTKEQCPIRKAGTLSERAPLAAVPAIQLSRDGKAVRLGRSSASCHYQLSAHRMISRVHVEARYNAAASEEEKDQLVVTCTGWNSMKVHCLGEASTLSKGDTFSSDAKGVDLMLDVHDARVLLRWPSSSPRRKFGDSGSSTSEEETSPSKLKAARRRSLHSSPVVARQRTATPVSPSPASRAANLPLSPLDNPPNPVVVYEDETAADGVDIENNSEPTQSTQIVSQATAALGSSIQSSLSELPDDLENDEENDPIIHSFGPFGSNLLPRMASFTANESYHNSPRNNHRAQGQPLKPTMSPSQPKAKSNGFDAHDHIVNQLAFSRLSSTPLSTILAHLPQEDHDISIDDVKLILESTACIGEVSRAGKDAAGKPLESEFYYIPDEDEDAKRREAVVNDLRKPGLRNCRKQHKQYFWRKPK
ncbi:MAG: hypothetical protein Q9227_001490 [Pyrenula ochraceoflavens]